MHKCYNIIHLPLSKLTYTLIQSCMAQQSASLNVQYYWILILLYLYFNIYLFEECIKWIIGRWRLLKKKIRANKKKIE
jgi:hypothetical protein